jgi:hypothetical protein
MEAMNQVWILEVVEMELGFKGEVGLVVGVVMSPMEEEEVKGVLQGDY